MELTTTTEIKCDYAHPGLVLFSRNYSTEPSIGSPAVGAHCGQDQYSAVTHEHGADLERPLSEILVILELRYDIWCPLKIFVNRYVEGVIAQPAMELKVIGMTQYTGAYLSSRFLDRHQRGERLELLS